MRCFLITLAAFWAAVPFLSAGSLKAGAAAIDITPTNLPIRTAGNLTETIVQKVGDPLHTRALVLWDGKQHLVLAVVDSCMISREDITQAKKLASKATGISVSNMMISSTHTHTAPAVYGCHGNDPEQGYLEFIIPRIAESIIAAYDRLEPARIASGAADLARFVHNRRWIMRPGTAQSPDPAFTGAITNIAMMNPGFGNTNKVKQTGPVDPQVTVLSVQTASGKPLSLVAAYSTHYASAPVHLISADYFGEFCRIIASELGGGTNFVAMMCNGTSGDANPIDFTKTNWLATPAIVAKAVAETALSAVSQAEYREEIKLEAATRFLSLDVRLPSREDVEKAQRYLATKVINRPIRNWEENYARETTLLAKWPPTKEITLQTFKVGNFAIASIPCETFSITGLRIKNESPFPLTMVIGLANGYHGYLPPPDQFPLGGYTTWRARTSYLETNAEPKIRAEIADLLSTVAK